MGNYNMPAKEIVNYAQNKILLEERIESIRRQLGYLENQVSNLSIEEDELEDILKVLDEVEIYKGFPVRIEKRDGLANKDEFDRFCMYSFVGSEKSTIASIKRITGTGLWKVSVIDPSRKEYKEPTVIADVDSEKEADKIAKDFIISGDEGNTP